MKRVIAFIMTVLLILSMSACGKSDAEKELERMKQSSEAFKRAADEKRQETEDFLNLLDEYNDAVSRLGSATD